MWAGLVLIAAFCLWIAAIWTKPSHQDWTNCECGHPHERESIMTDSFYAMSGLWLIAGWGDKPCIKTNNQGR